ncbi:hypothetical protein U1Q18_038663 [Sarracenia purpurea var. burkii]
MILFTTVPDLAPGGGLAPTDGSRVRNLLLSPPFAFRVTVENEIRLDIDLGFEVCVVVSNHQVVACRRSEWRLFREARGSIRLCELYAALLLHRSEVEGTGWSTVSK